MTRKCIETTPRWQNCLSHYESFVGHETTILARKRRNKRSNPAWERCPWPSSRSSICLSSVGRQAFHCCLPLASKSRPSKLIRRGVILQLVRTKLVNHEVLSRFKREKTEFKRSEAYKAKLGLVSSGCHGQRRFGIRCNNQVKEEYEDHNEGDDVKSSQEATAWGSSGLCGAHEWSRSRSRWHVPAIKGAKGPT